MAVLEKPGKHCTESVSCSETVTALSSDEAEFCPCSEQRRMRCKHSISRQAWDDQCERLCKVAATGISSRSSAGKLRHPRVKELWIQELVRAQKLVIKKVGPDDIFADVGTKYIEDGKKVHLLSLSGVRMKRSVELIPSVLERSAALHLRLRKETTFRSDGLCGSLPVATQRTKQVCVARWTSALPPSVPSSRFTQTRYSAVLCLLLPNMPWTRNRCWTADALCRLDSSFTPQYDSEQDFGSPEALILRGEEPSEDDKPFLPRFLLQEVIFRAQPIRGGLFSGEDWFCLRGIAATGGAARCEHPGSGKRPSSRRSLPAPVLFGEFSWQPDRAPWYGSSVSAAQNRISGN